MKGQHTGRSGGQGVRRRNTEHLVCVLFFFFLASADDCERMRASRGECELGTRVRARRGSNTVEEAGRAPAAAGGDVPAAHRRPSRPGQPLRRGPGVRGHACRPPRPRCRRRRQQQRRLTDGELVGLCSEFLGAATEPAASALQWIMANLVKRPDVQRALREEIDAAVGAAGWSTSTPSSWKGSGCTPPCQWCSGR